LAELPEGGRGVPPLALGGDLCEVYDDSNDKIQIRWRRKILKFNKSVRVWFGSKV